MAKKKQVARPEDIIKNTPALSIKFQLTDLESSINQIVEFFNKGQVVLNVKGGRMALLNKLTEILPFNEGVIDPLFQAKRKIVDSFNSQQFERLKVEEKLNKIKGVKELKKELEKIDFIQNALKERVGVVDDYCIREMEQMKANGEREKKSAIGTSFKWRENPARLQVDAKKQHKLPKDCVSKTIELNQAQEKCLRDAGLLEDKQVQYSQTTEQKKILLTRLKEQKKQNETFDKADDETREAKGLTKVLKKDMIDGASLLSSVGLDGDFNTVKIK